MTDSADTNNSTPETVEQNVDVFWIVANIFAIIHLLEEKFGAEAVEKIVMVATTIENNMREETATKE